jgi:hypothetical protein
MKVFDRPINYDLVCGTPPRYKEHLPGSAGGRRLIVCTEVRLYLANDPGVGLGTVCDRLMKYRLGMISLWMSYNRYDGRLPGIGR